ncbi:MAG: hypothetical protein DRO87_11110 [Candidatus Thorarchaeota archaeon]|nr:MAG: hypothetical protein DRO87_11110 [Candidatus Thorarchaeota archaeon]RLI56215.1 MAG: hypothetical protein DRP09_07000 [Candidatus Thorarchaeota archaeon]
MVRCAFCDADFQAGPGDVLLVCPYCGTAQTREGAKFSNHYMIRVHFDQYEAQTTLLDWVSKQLGVPADLPVKAKFVKSEQVWYPFWISRVDARSTYRGLGRDATFHNRWPQRPEAYKRIEYFWKPESGEFTRRHEINIAAVANIDEDVKNFPIPTRAKEYFSHAHAEEFDGKVLHSNMTEEQAKDFARKVAFTKQTALIMEEVDKIEERQDDIDVGETFLIHVPVWELTYRYGKRKYRASVSASTGYVIESKYPRSMAFRAGSIGVGLIMALIGAGLIAWATGFIDVPDPYPGGSLSSGALIFVIGLVLLYKGASRKEAKEEV